MLRSNAKMGSLTMLALLLATSAAMVSSRAEGPAAPQQTPAAQADELSRLHFLLGEWTYVNEYPSGSQDTGIYLARLGPGGKSIITEFSGKGAMGEFSAMEIFTWNATAEQYEGYAFVSLAPGCGVRQGNWEDGRLVFHRKGGAQEFRYVYRMDGENTLVIELYVGGGEKPFALFMTTRARKSPSPVSKK